MTLPFLLLAIGGLLVLAMVQVRPAPRSLALVGLVAVGGLGTSLLLRSASAALDYHPDSWGVRLAKELGGDLSEAATDPGVERVIIVEGSSYSARGLDGAMLGRLLSHGTGNKTAVVQLTLDGANHFERSWLLALALDRLGEADRERLAEKHVTLLMEIQRGYDFAPLNGFLRNEGSDRTYAYMTIRNGWDGLRAVQSLGDQARDPVRELLPAVMSHAAVNALSIGLVHRGVRYEDVKPMDGYQPLKRAKRGYRHRGTDKVLELARRLDRGEIRPSPPQVPWVDTVRVPRYRALLAGLVDREAFFAVPSTEVEDLLYVAGFCSRYEDVACITYGDPALLKRLDRRADWNDRRHMRVGGAEKFTRWFARRYLRDTARSDEA